MFTRFLLYGFLGLHDRLVALVIDLALRGDILPAPPASSSA